MKKTLLGILSLVLMANFAGPSAAEASGSAVQQQQPTKEKIHELIVMRLTQNLGLSASQSKDLSAILQKYHERRSQLRQQMHDLSLQLKTASTSGKDEDIQKLIAQAGQLKSNYDQLDGQRFEEVKKILNPRQQAQFLVQMDEIKSEIRAAYRPPAGPPSDLQNPNDFPGSGVSNGPNAVQVGH